jgi:mobilizable transposon, int protein
MRNKRNYTKSTVRLRKSEYRDEWHVYIESYPVMVEGKNKPQRIRKYINRSVKTVVFDKKRTSRTTLEKTTYKPKRDDNGIIICKSDLDKETMLYADSIRKIIQQGFDERELNSELRNSQISQQEKVQENFIQYFKKVIGIRHKKSSKSIIINWHRTVSFLEMFVQNDILSFEKIDYKFIEDFKRFLLDAPCGVVKKEQFPKIQHQLIFQFLKPH